MNIIIYILIILTVFTISVNAETGTINVTTYSEITPYEFAVQGTSHSITWNKFSFYNTGYNTVARYRIHAQTTALFPAGEESGSTNFICTAGCIGYGYVEWSKSTKNITWTFNNDLKITSALMEVTYNTNIFSGFPLIREAADHPSATKPMGLFDRPGYEVSADLVGAAFTNEVLFVGAKVPFQYNVTYSNFNSNVIFTAFVDKSGTGSVTSKIKMHSATVEYFTETTFNTVNVTTTQTYLDGLYINFTLSSGGFYDLLINSTNAPVVPGQAGTNQTTITKPDSGVNIVFDKSSYFVGDNVNITYWFSDNEWNALGAKYMNIYLNDALQEDISGAFKHGLNSQKGYYIYSAVSSGTLKAEVVREILFISKSTWDASVEILPPGNSWIALSNSTSYAKLPVNVTYHLGYSVSTYPPAAIEIQTIESSTGNKVDNVFPDVFPDGTIPIGVIHPFPPGNYSIRLYDVVKNQVLDVKTLQVVLQPSVIPVLGISTSSISTDKSVYFYNDYMQVTFEVDDVKFSNYSIRGDIIDVNTSQVTKRIYSPFTDQVGTYTTIINIDKKQKCENGLNCWFNTGNNSINLIAYNSTASLTIAYANFTVSSTTSDGYGLQVSTITPSANVPFQVTTIVPTLHIGLLIVANDGYKKIVYSVNQTVASGTNTIPVTISPVNNNGVAYYVAELWGDDGLLKVKIPLTVSQPVVTTTTATSSGTALQVTGFLSSNIFWALVFIIGFMLAIAVYERRGK